MNPFTTLTLILHIRDDLAYRYYDIIERDHDPSQTLSIRSTSYYSFSTQSIAIAKLFKQHHSALSSFKVAYHIIS